MSEPDREVRERRGPHPRMLPRAADAGPCVSPCVPGRTHRVLPHASGHPTSGPSVERRATASLAFQTSSVEARGPQRRRSATLLEREKKMQVYHGVASVT